MIHSFWECAHQGSLHISELPLHNVMHRICLPPQIAYAARDAQVSVALFLHLLRLPFVPQVERSECALPGWEKGLRKCQDLVDVPFKERNTSCLGDDENMEGDLQQKTKNHKSSLSNEQCPVSQPGKDPRKHKRKPLGVGYSTR